MNPSPQPGEGGSSTPPFGGRKAPHHRCEGTPEQGLVPEPTRPRPFPNALFSRKVKAQGTPVTGKTQSSQRGDHCDAASGEHGPRPSPSRHGRPASPRGSKGRHPRGDSRLSPSWPPESQGTRPAARPDGPQSPRSILSTSPQTGVLQGSLGTEAHAHTAPTLRVHQRTGVADSPGPACVI